MRRSRDLEAYLRGQIVNGDWPKGNQIPLLESIESSTGLSRATAVRALRRLREDGFIIPRGCLGTWVAERLPFEYTYGLIFSRHLEDFAKATRAVVAMQEAAAAISSTGDVSIRSYNLTRFDPKIPSFAEAMEHARTSCLGGAVFFHPYRTELVDEFAEVGLPLVVVTPRHYIPDSALPRHDWLFQDHRMFWRKTASWVHDRNCRRVAVFSVTPLDPLYAEELGNNGVSVDPDLLLDTGPNLNNAAKFAALLMRLPPSERPDALIIADDNLLEPVTGVLTEAGCRVPEDIAVLTMVNWPSPVASSLPACRLGFDAVDTLRRAIRRLRDPPSDGDDPARWSIPALFEAEYLELANTVNKGLLQ